MSDLDWDDEATNASPFKVCPVCKGNVVAVSYEPLVKTCEDCGKTYSIPQPLTFVVQRHNVADSIAYSLHESGLSWSAVGIVMRLYHNIENGKAGWRHRVTSRYGRRDG